MIDLVFKHAVQQTAHFDAAAGAGSMLLTGLRLAPERFEERVEVMRLNGLQRQVHDWGVVKVPPFDAKVELAGFWCAPQSRFVLFIAARPGHEFLDRLTQGAGCDALLFLL